jgi:bifunctional DNase/RNase
MKKVDLEIVDIALSGSSSGAYALVLGELGGTRRLPIVIGATEAQAIAIEMEQMKASRPLTHDLFFTAFETFGLSVTEVLIYNMVEGIFYAKLICTDGDRVEEIDSRPSDAVALACRFKAPIRCYDSVIQSAGIDSVDEPESPEFEIEEDEVEMDEPMSVEELQTELDEAINREDYERASKLRDEIERRKAD